MSYEGSDILFEFFFNSGYPISWSSREFDFGLDVNSVELSAHQARLAVESGQSSLQDARFPVSVLLELEADAGYAIQAISVSALRLAVEGSGWTYSGMDLELIGPGVIGGWQMLLTVREEDRFTN